MPQDKSVEAWMARLDPSLTVTPQDLRHLVLQAVPGLTESIKWGNPVYETEGKVCYIAATSKYVSLGFFNGASLTDPEKRIEGTGAKMRHVKVWRVADMDRDQLTAWIQEAVALNQRS